MKIDIVRVGHPARILPTIYDHALEIRVRTCDEAQIVKDIRDEMDRELKAIPKCRNKMERKAKYQEIKTLKKELIQREAGVVSGILKNAQVVLCTLNGSANRKMERLIKERGLFDTILIDEATQALEAECWIGIQKAKRVILAGDHLQLPVSSSFR